MRKNIIILVFVYLICSGEAGLLRKQQATPMEQLQKLKEMNKYAKNLVSNLELHLTTGGKVDEVISLVRNAQSEAQENLRNLRQEHSEESLRLQGLIDEYTNTVSHLNTELLSTVGLIKNLDEEISIYELKIQNVRSDIDALNQREQALEKARENDDIAFQRRQQRDSNTISVLMEIIPQLENLLSTGSAFLQKSQHDISYALKKIPQQKSIQMLVELSTQFDADKLKEVVERLTDILEAVKASRNDDKNSEIKSRAKFQVLLEETQKIRSIKGELLSSYISNRDAKEAERNTAVSLRESISSNLQNTNSLLSSTQQVKEFTDQTYSRRIQEAQNAVDALKSALDILTENESTLQVQESRRQEQQEQGRFY